ncbi:protein of unknown function DUF188 [Alkaliphilus metalliredigens QYMF]|uniref:UPF0178 protein Amet_2995 n=1 Tax=Alkaliphilus metalliredigens (strain QYMF) TaxID=293826 RepID=Y2995_ALKMQ|nr:YaiI/YqxD family protein [Alkaliphilus metalliredigens]A6TSH1.1 RecName: Full=UPF0178 protein Amet_2995 [Alkaliphilus metalliredigens QYMF]ABR49139.1 protein of unknown function DUF188 [Alkaliphilus metalliredigens QYMF]
MKVIIDGDACPVKNILFNICEHHDLELILVHSIAHMSKGEQKIETIIVDNEAEAADIMIMNRTKAGDLVITADTGLAALVLGKRAFVLSPWGHFYTNDNIGSLLDRRYLNRKMMLQGGRVKGPKKRNKEDDHRFQQALESFLEKHLRNSSKQEGV